METGEPIQGVFDFESGNSDGLANWRREREACLEAVRREWGVPVGRRVRLRLRHMDEEFEGRLQLVRHPLTMDRHRPLHLRLGTVDFFAAEIEWCGVIE
jgi:hypothetical protein